MSRLRTLIRVWLWLTASLVAVVAVFLVLSQTPWFKERLRRLAMRQAERVLDGQLVIGRLEGTLFTGVTLYDVSVVQEGAPVVAIDRVRVTYGIGEILSDGRVIATLEVQRPIVQLVRTPTGWNIARLVKPRPPSDPDKPRATFALPDIVVRDGVVTVEERDVPRTEALPRRFEGLQFSGSVTSVPEYLRVDIGELAVRADDPAVTLESLSGRVTNVREGWHLQDVSIQTDDSDVRVDGSITHASPSDPWIYALTVHSARLSLPQIGRFVPALVAYELHPSLEVTLDGPRDALAMDVDVRTRAGNARGTLTLDTTGPMRLEGNLDVEGVNLEPFVHDPEAAGRITGNAVFDLRFPSEMQGEPVDGTFTFRGPEASAYGYEARAVRASGRLAGRRIELDAEASAYGGRATTRGHLVRAGGAQRELTLDLAGRVENVDLRALPEQIPVPDLETRITGTYVVSGPLSTIQASGTLDTSQVEGAEVASGTTGNFARLSDGFTFDADGSVAGLDLRRLGRALDIVAMQEDRFESDVSGRFVVRGTQRPDEPLHLEAEGTLVDTVALGGRLPHLDVTATLSGGALDVRALGSIAGYDLPTLSGVDALTGTVTGTVDTTVRFRDLDDVAIDTIDVDGRFVLDAPVLMDVPFARVEADVRMADGVVDVRSLTGEGDGFTLTGRGPLALGERGTSAFQYRLKADSLLTPARVADLPLVGSGIAEGTITGPRAAFRVDGTFDGASVAYADVASAAAATASYVVLLPDLDASRLDVSSDVVAETVEVAGLTLQEVSGRVGYVPQQVSYDVVASDGVRRITAVGVLDIADDAQVVRLTAASIERDAVRWTLAPGTAAVVTVQESRLQIAPLQLVNGLQRIDVAGAVALSDAATNDLRIDAENVDVVDVMHLADEQQDVQGRLRFEAVVGGTRAVPTATATLEVEAARFRDLDIERVEASVEFDGRQAHVDALVRQSAQAYLTAKGVVPRWLFEPVPDNGADPPADERLDVAVRSTAIDLALVEAVTAHVRNVQGVAAIDARITSVGRRPVADGSVRINGGSFLVPYTGVTYRNLEASLLFEDDHLRIERLSLETRDGSPLVVTGQLGLQREEPQSVVLNVKGERFRVMNNAWGQAEIDADLQVRGTLVAPAIEGDVTVTTGRLELDQILAQFAPGAYATEADYQGIPTRTDPDAPPVVPNIMGEGPVSPFTIERRDDSMAGALFEELSLNVRVRIPDNLLMRGRNVEFGRNAIGDVNVTMGGDFRVVKTADDPVVLVGTVNTVRGTYAYQGRRFEISRDGQVIFRGDPSNTPDLDITAERVIQGVEARVRIQGPADEPTLELSSNPPLDEADVLALIVFNQPVNQLGAGQQNTLMQRAGGVAAGFVVSPIAQALGDTLDLDLFDVETTDEMGRVNPAVVIGQQVTPDLFVKFRQQFGNQQVSQFLLEYRLADFLRVQSSFAEGEGLSRAQRSLAQRIERYGMDLVFYFAF